MGDLGVFASRFSVNSKSLEEFDEALRYMKKRPDITGTPEETAMVDKLLTVVIPILKHITRELSESTAISERSVVDIIKGRHEREWPRYKERIQELTSRLDSKKFELSSSDFDLLNDVADALDAECASLFRRMSDR